MFPNEDELYGEEEETEEALESGEHSLIKRSVLLPEDHGEWILPEEPDTVEEDSPSTEASPADTPSDLYTSFAQKIAAVPRLSEEEEKELGIKIRDFSDKAAAKKLALHNMRLAVKMAHQYRRSWTNLMDLVQEASTGLAIAAQRWDPDKGTRFGTYASYWIKAQLAKFLMTNGRLIHTATTRAGRKVYFNLPHIQKQLQAKGIEANAYHVAKEVGEDPKEVELILSRLQSKEASLNSPLGYDNSSTLQDTLSNQEESPEDQTAKLQVNQLITDIIARFEKTLQNERDVALWREHLIASEPVSLVDLGKRFGVSKQRMGQLAIRLKRAFRRHIIDELGPHTQLHWLFSD